MFEHRPLMMRANRGLGANLVEHNLIRLEALEAANARFLDLVQGGEAKPRHLLSILLNEQQSLAEAALLQLQTDELGLGLIDLRTFDTAEELRVKYDPGVCWATATVPFDREEDVTFVATSYYLSPIVREHWKRELGGSILWYATSMDAIVETLEAREQALAAAKRNARS